MAGHSRRDALVQCPVPGCRAQARPRKLCPRHWHYVPGNLRWWLQYVSRKWHRTPRHDLALERVAMFAAAAEDYIESSPYSSRDGSDPPGTIHRAFDSPGWRPGRGVRRRVVARAAQTGESFEQAAEAIRVGMLRRHRLNTEMLRRESEATRSERERLRAQRKTVYPEPNSVRAIPTGFETKRRRH